MSQQVIYKLVDCGWEFKDNNAMPCVEFKSSRLKNFYLYPGEEFTEAQIREIEVEAFLGERAMEFRRLCDKAEKEYIEKSRKVLKLGDKYIPNEVTLTLKFD